MPIRLWCYCGRHPEENGTLTDFSADDVEAVILKWWGRKGKAFEAMVKAGFIDQDGPILKAHGWDRRNGHIPAFHKRAVHAANVRWGKLTGDATSIAPSNATSITKQCPTDLPTNQPNKKQKTNAHEGETKNALVGSREEAFLRFWCEYPRKRAKGDAEKAWKSINPGDELIARILASLVRAKTSRDWLVEGGRFVPYPATWLRGKRWEDDVGVPSAETKPQEEVNTAILEIQGLSPKGGSS